MSNPEQTPKSPAAKTGLFATLSSLLRGDGTGAPSTSLGTPSPQITKAEQAHLPAGVGPRRRASLGFASVLAIALTALLALAAAPGASAAPYRFEAAQSEALSAGVPGGAFAEPFGLTFDSTGNLYVSDAQGNAGDGVIDKFDSENAFTAQFGATIFANRFLRGIAVNDETGHIYAGDPEGPLAELGSLYALGADGAELSQWTGANTPAGTFGEHFVQVAVDNSPSVSHGDVYAVTAQAGGEIDVFEPQNGDAEEGKFLRKLEVPGGFSFGGQEGIAVNQSNGDVYVADQGHGVVDVFSPTGTLETQITGPSPGKFFQEPVAVAVNGANGHLFVVDDTNTGVNPVYEFNAAGGLVNEIAGVGLGEPFKRPTGIAVQEAGPHAGELYVVDAGRKTVDVFAEQQPGTPLIAAEGVQDLLGSRATFVGEINPQGAATQYRVEYGPCGSPTTCTLSPYPSSVPIPDAILSGEGFTPQAIAPVTVSGLLAATTYHFRLVAHNANGDATGEERVFATQGPAIASQLPDGRQWELVSPPDKQSGTVGGGTGAGLIQAAADGSAVTYLSNAPIESSTPGYVNGGQVLSTRKPSGWSSRELGTAHPKPVGAPAGLAPPYQLFNEDLSAAVIQPYGLFNPSLSPAASEQTPYRQALGSCSASCFTPLVTGKEGSANVPPGTEFGEELFCEENNGVIAVVHAVCGPLIESGTRDGQHLVLRSEEAALVPDAPAHSLYEWNSGQLSLISILPPNEAGEELPAPDTGDFQTWPRLGTRFGLSNASARRSISADGSRVFWSDGTNLYMRDMVKEQTIQIDTPEVGCPLGEGEGQCQGGSGIFQIASADGSRVYFTDAHRLTADSGAAKAQSGPLRDLYECRIEEAPSGDLSCDPTDLTPLEGTQSANVQGNVLGASEDGSAIYFVADGTLSGAGSERGTCLERGLPQFPGAHCNLYLLKDGAAPQLVASLSGEDQPLWGPTELQSARVSPDGRWLAFMSAARLTSYDNTDAHSGKPDAEVYLYDAGDHGLTCASCEPSGARPTGVEYRKLENGESRVLRTVRGQWEGWVAALLPESLKSVEGTFAYQPRFLSNSGRLYFNSLDALVPQDSNGTGDVYQYEPAGIGSCTTSYSTYLPQSGGCIDLISSGTSPERSYFLDASQSGDDVFFFTFSRLTSQDVDQRVDVYDAHVCSDVASCFPEPPPASPACEGDACQQPAVPPNDATPGSLTFNGAGNLTECPKGKVKKRGKCVAKKHKSKKHKKKAHKRHAKSNRGASK